MSNGSKSGSKPSASQGASGAGSSASISSSFLGLKAELERSKASLASSSSSSAKRKSSSSTTTAHSDIKQKKLSSTFLDTSPTKISKRSSDADEDTKRKKRTPSTPREPSTSQLDKIRSNLERKARIYDQLQSGKYAGFTTAELKEGSIDWERKRAEPRPPFRSPSPRAEVDEAEIEYEDEFGRTRRSKISDVPREFLPAKYGGDLEEEEEMVDNAVYGPSTSFPVYDPSLHRREKEERKRFDSGFEKRHRGAAFYKFSNEEGERRAQMHQLAELRRETLERRRDGQRDVT